MSLRSGSANLLSLVLVASRESRRWFATPSSTASYRNRHHEPAHTNQLPLFSVLTYGKLKSRVLHISHLCVSGRLEGAAFCTAGLTRRNATPLVVSLSTGSRRELPALVTLQGRSRPTDKASSLWRHRRNGIQ